jgi:hypothetical protein
VRHVRVSRRNGRLILRIEEHGMGKKYDDYAKAAQAETTSKVRYEAELIGGDDTAIRQAANDLNQNSAIANALYDEWSDDVNG